MLHNDGTPQLDANTGTQAAFDNLLVLYSASTPRDDGRTLDYDLTMGGRPVAQRRPPVAHHLDPGHRLDLCLL